MENSVGRIIKRSIYVRFSDITDNIFWFQNFDPELEYLKHTGLSA